MNNVGQYIKSLIIGSGHSQSDIARSIGVQRQLLSYIVAGRRELSLPLALKLESFFNLPEGKLLKMQAENNVHSYKRQLKNELAVQLLRANAFWSYANVSAKIIPDEELIERTFIYLDMKDIAKLFELYSRDYVRKVWREKMAIQGDYLFSLNVMIALYYFDIRQPEKYLMRIEREHIKQLTSA
jgi:plasmid maintenance system antidote protein VapI